MHELAITQSVVDAVTERTGSRRWRASGCGWAGWPASCPTRCGSASSSSRPGRRSKGRPLEIDEPAGRGRCRTCGEDFALADLVLLCGCGSADVEVLAGRELAVASVVLAGPAA